MEHLHVDPGHTVVARGPNGIRQMSGQAWNDFIDQSDTRDPGYTYELLSTHPTAADAVVWLRSLDLA